MHSPKELPGFINESVVFSATVNSRLCDKQLGRMKELKLSFLLQIF